MAPGPSRWAWTCLAAGGVFLGLAAAVSLWGVSAYEHDLYRAIVAALPDQHSHLFFWLTRLGGKIGLVPAAIFLIVLMPRPLLRRWWLWAAAILLVVALEGVGKVALGRGRPESLRSGFPSGHTAAAAIFYLVAGYFAAAAASRRARWLYYGAAGGVMLLVGLSRIVRRAHWPLDVAGGIALGVAVFAAAAWWHERNPLEEGRPPSAAFEALRAWVHRWQVAIPIPFFAVVLLEPPMGVEDWLLDLLFDGVGGGLVAAGLWLRLWAAGHSESRPALPKPVPTQLVTTGPHAWMRHPLMLANVLIGVGVVLLGESGPGLVLIPAVLITVYRITTSMEEASLLARHGHAYADYCARVPSLPRPTRELFAAAGFVRWAAVRAELPVLAGILVVAIVADASAYLPHLFP